jgi:hypothetical protein
MDTNDLQYEKIKVVKGVKQDSVFIRDLNVIRSMSSEKYSELLDFYFELYFKNEPIDFEFLKDKAKDIEETMAKAKSAIDLTIFIFKNAVKYDLTEEEFKEDLDNLRLDVHAKYLVNCFTKYKNKFEEKEKEKKVQFLSELVGCEWRLERQIGLSYGMKSEDLVATVKFVFFKVDGNGSTDNLTLETNIDMLKSIVMTLEDCLDEAAKCQTKTEK